MGRGPRAITRLNSQPNHPDPHAHWQAAAPTQGRNRTGDGQPMTMFWVVAGVLSRLCRAAHSCMPEQRESGRQAVSPTDINQQRRGPR